MDLRRKPSDHARIAWPICAEMAAFTHDAGAISCVALGCAPEASFTSWKMLTKVGAQLSQQANRAPANRELGQNVMSEGVNSRQGVPQRNDAFDIEIFDDQIVACDREGGHIVHMNATASFIWALVDGTRDLDQIIAEIIIKYPEAHATAEQEVRSTIELFVAQKLVALKNERPF